MSSFPTLHKCLAQGCTRTIVQKMLMCRWHWSMVPKDIQHRVYSTYKAWKQGGVGSVAEYVEARSAAAAAVSAKEAVKRGE